MNPKRPEEPMHEPREQCARWLEDEAGNLLRESPSVYIPVVDVSGILRRYAERIRTLNLDREDV